jgi:hypothetical protein
MPAHTDIAPPEEKSERAPLAQCDGVVVGSPRPCPICGAALTGRQQACSGKCRAAKSRRRRIPLPVTEVRKIRASLRTALEAVSEAKATLERYGR